ncbi:MAG: hypothetical protein HRU29_11265 [Rhizobiales bacterium]|nr:hypothetical protein [Hyphomicrobiales bacterium]NRB14968.1 hypothetical protein [Hyphomicrobiales bacterium]
MNFDSFSHSKYKNNPFGGDDVVLHIPGRLYAVFDGATDAHNNTVNGVSVGRVAASTVAAEMSNLVGNDVMHERTPSILILEKLRRSLADKFSRNKILSLPSTTAAMVFEFPNCYRLLVIGDSSIRINGLTVYSKKKLIDIVSTYARVWVFKHLRDRLDLENDKVEALVRRVSFLGLDLAAEEAVLTAENVQQIITAVVGYSGLVNDENEVAGFLKAGIQSQYIYANNAESVLGYGCLNSTEFLARDAIDIYLPKSEVRMIEIFSDGYLSEPQNCTNIANWEDEFNMVENLDYHKLDMFPSIKGSTLEQFSDDRSIIILSE